MDLSEREEELKFFYNWIYCKNSEEALTGLRSMREELQKDLRRLKGELEEAEEEIAEIETKEENLEAAEDSAFE